MPISSELLYCSDVDKIESKLKIFDIPHLFKNLPNLITVSIIIIYDQKKES